MKTFIATLACTAAASSAISQETYRFWTWALDHGKSYQSEEEHDHRFQLWMTADAEIERLNNSGLPSTHAHNRSCDPACDGPRTHMYTVEGGQYVHLYAAGPPATVP